MHRRLKHILTISLLGILLITGGCHKDLAGSRKKHLKKGKPIPCPIKDC